MSDLPELNLFEEIQGIANSSDFYTYTQEEFNKTWTHYEDETAGEMKAVNRVGTPTSSLPTTPPSSGKSSPTRDTWDPMLWHTRSMEEAELRALTELAVTPPISPSLPSFSLASCPCQGGPRQSSWSSGGRSGQGPRRNRKPPKKAR